MSARYFVQLDGEDSPRGPLTAAAVRRLIEQGSVLGATQDAGGGGVAGTIGRSYEKGHGRTGGADSEFFQLCQEVLNHRG